MNSEPALPQLRLDLDALDTNVAVLAAWCIEHDVSLAPHVKTTMSEPIVARQLAAGAVAVTVATVDQVATVLGWGHRSVLVANEVVDRGGLERIRFWVNEDPGREIRILVDSLDGVYAAEAVFPGVTPRLDVLLDVGTPGGRTGVRTVAAARELAERVALAPGLRLIGVAGYEGVVANSRASETVAAVDTHCRLVREVYLNVADLFDTDAPIFSMGGSAFPDRVVQFLPGKDEVPGTVRLLRSGCYVTHDHGTYASVSRIEGLLPALSVRAVVLSTPEPGMVVLGAGKRDLPYDAGYPLLLSGRSSTGADLGAITGTVRTLYDHHAVLTQATGLSVTDVVDLGISHPCSAFDRWPDFVVTDRHGTELAVWQSSFQRAQIAPPTG